jgi:hypothetical protein
MQAVSGENFKILNFSMKFLNFFPLKCHCGKLFKKKSSLTTHKFTHSTINFPCHCGAIFKCEQYLKNHSRRKHTEVGSAAAPPAKRPCLSPAAENELNMEIKEERQEETSFDPMELLKMQMSVEA